jgi:ArsR family transcriptional regulator, arsenate/arsenite/antimonite-responsive transcriptional repressor / arsenate reductase (thioredoxin)
MDNSSDQPPEVLRMLAHPLRWQLIKLLLLSDLRVQELVEQVQEPNNLISYHLKLLRATQLVVQRKSDADGRDLYYHLNVEKLQKDYRIAAQEIYPGWIWKEAADISTEQEATRVLFLCTHNSIRSQMAEGLLRQMGGGKYWVMSAGSQPRQVNPDAVDVMGKLGIDISHQVARHLDEIKGQSFDFTVTVCDRIREESLSDNFSKINIHWSIADPADIVDPEKRHQGFMLTAQELKLRIRHFMAYAAAQKGLL